MSKRIFFRTLFTTIVIVGILGFSNILFAQGQSNEAFELVRQIQETYTGPLMDLPDVEGTAIGFDENNQLALKVFT